MRPAPTMPPTAAATARARGSPLRGCICPPPPNLIVARRPLLVMGILAGPRVPGQWPCRDTGFFTEVFLYSFAKGPADDDGTPPDDGPPPADAPRPSTGRPQRAHPGGLPPRRQATRRPIPHPA